MVYIANARMPTEKAHGIQIAKMCEAFLEQGIDLKLLVPRRGRKEQSLKEFYGLRVSVPVIQLPALSTYEKGRLGFIAGTIIFMVSYFLYCFFERLKKRIDAIYTTDIDQFFFLFIPFLAIPYWVELHDAKPWSIRYAFFLGRARGIIVINSLIQKEIADVFTIPKERIIVHPNGIDMGQFGNPETRENARARIKIPRDARIALYVGKFYSWKGLPILVHAAKELRGGMIYAVGGTREELQKVTEIEHISDSLICAGSRAHQEIPLWISAADVLLVLGTKKNVYSWLHTSPMKLFEYLPSGRPIVASRTPAIQDIVSESEVLFYEPDNPASLAQTIEEAWSLSKEVIRKKSEVACEKARQYTWERRAQSILSFITN